MRAFKKGKRLSEPILTQIIPTRLQSLENNQPASNLQPKKLLIEKLVHYSYPKNKNNIQHC